MAVYEYKALKHDGTPTTGVIDADSPRDARTKLRAQELHVTDLETYAAARAKEIRIELPFGKTLSRKRLSDMAVLTRQLGTLLNAGIPLAQAMNAMIEQTDDKAVEAVLRDARERITQGASFADALAFHPKYFGELYVNMVRAGEASGSLDQVLHRLADYLQKQARTRGKIAAAMTYPVIMLIVGAGVVIFLMSFVVPQIVNRLVQQRGLASLPLPTVILMTVSDFVKTWWWALLAAVFGGLAFLRILTRTPAGRLAWDGFLLKLPLLGDLFKKTAISRFATTFATLLESGIPAMEALSIVKQVVDNMVLSKVIEEVRAKVIEGADISTPLKNSKIFPPVVSYMIAIGEESGKLEELLRKVSDAYDEEVDITTQKVTTLLEPLMIIALAVVVGFIVLAVLLPILEQAKGFGGM
ncbi:MAG: type II secretion system inner membrane protein GspF [Planctomycetota bacterium]